MFCYWCPGSCRWWRGCPRTDVFPGGFDDTLAANDCRENNLEACESRFCFLRNRQTEHSCSGPSKQQLGTALPLRERRALCCSMVPFGEGLGSSLGFDAPFSLLDAAAYVDGRPGKRTTQTTLTTTRADLGEHPPGTYCRPGSTACGLGRRPRYGLRFHRSRDPTAVRRHSTFVANSGFGSRGEGPLPSSGVRTNS